MIIGLYFTITSGLIAGHFVAKHPSHFPDVIKTGFCETCTCCTPQMLLPLWMLQYLGMQTYDDKCGRLWCVLCGFFIFYCMIWVPSISWLLGIILFRSSEDPGSEFGWGLLLYIVLELIVVFFFMVYLWFSEVRRSRERLKQLMNAKPEDSRTLLDNQEENSRLAEEIMGTS